MDDNNIGMKNKDEIKIEDNQNKMESEIVNVIIKKEVIDGDPMDSVVYLTFLNILEVTFIY